MNFTHAPHELFTLTYVNGSSDEVLIERLTDDIVVVEYPTVYAAGLRIARIERDTKDEILSPLLELRSLRTDKKGRKLLTLSKFAALFEC